MSIEPDSQESIPPESNDDQPGGDHSGDLLNTIEKQRELLSASFETLRSAALELQQRLQTAEQQAVAAEQQAREAIANAEEQATDVAAMLPPGSELPAPNPIPQAVPTAAPIPDAMMGQQVPQAVPQAAVPQAAVPKAAVPQPGFVAPQPTDDEWSQVILGFELAQNPMTSQECQQLLIGLRQNDAAAVGLVGHLLMVRSAEAEKLPKLLKEVGEAYYRWRPYTGGVDAFLQALVDWLHRVCEAVGIQNKIRIVQAGDRFDSTRHSAKERGIEISDVFGWIVLRDNGKAYAKANVAVK